MITTFISDDVAIINTQGIRTATWGESQYPRENKFFITVTYKGNEKTFYYPTAQAAQETFRKLREKVKSL